MLTRNDIIRLLKAADFEEIEITCPDGAICMARPVNDMCEKPENAQDIEVFFLDWDLCRSDEHRMAMAWNGQNAIDILLDKCNRHTELMAEARSEEARLQAYFDDHQANGWTDDDLSWYSDWHKDVYGYRPHGAVCGRYINPHDPLQMLNAPQFNRKVV